MKQIIFLFFALLFLSYQGYSEEYIRMNKPLGGEKLHAGSDYTIKWHKDSVSNFNINIAYWDYSTQIWSDIAVNYPSDNEQYVWTIPTNLLGKKIMIKLYNQDLAHESSSLGFISIVSPPLIKASMFDSEEPIKQFGVFPNPSNGTISIFNEYQNKGHIYVYDMLGNVVYENGMQDTQIIDINLQKYVDAGSYLIRCRFDNGIEHTEKVIITK